MKRYYFQILLACCLTLFAGCSDSDSESGQNGIPKGSKAIDLQQDRSGLLRNPCMGWGLYDDAVGNVANAEEYWAAQDEAARNYASFFYIRWRWSEMEPEEGKYAWIYDENYKKLIQGALDRGLKLCFRIYDNGQDNIRQGTPEYVRAAGAQGYEVEGQNNAKLWTPYADDPIFQQKYEKFVAAFAKEYDNPDIVDFIDGHSLGWWGEGSHIKYLNSDKKKETFDWFTTMYSKNFKNIILVLPYNSEIGFNTEKEIAIDQKGYGLRRDGLGSMWFTENDEKVATEMYGKVLMVGECAYWGGYTAAYEPFKNDTKYSFKSWKDVYNQSFDHAQTYHFNTLDLRTITETKGWTGLAPELVRKFVLNGGYRVYPTYVIMPYEASAGQTVSISHSWRNTGYGYLPNNMKNWNYKYKPAFALFDESGKLVKSWIDEDAEPSQWLSNQRKNYTYEVSLDGISRGNYQWAVAIVDKTKDNQPGINIGIKDKEKKDGWTFISEMTIK